SLRVIMKVTKCDQDHYLLLNNRLWAGKRGVARGMNLRPASLFINRSRFGRYSEQLKRVNITSL
ncbi:MAG TPA: hypothetical protein DEG10_04990, partial [Leclercia adecarboxylata]|nr:hypothetical protein [Leclercia adecarboxylata]